MENTYEDDFKAIAILCERGNRDNAKILFDTLVSIIKEDTVLQECPFCYSTLKKTTK